MRIKDLIAPFYLCILLGSFPQQTPGQAVSGNIIGTVTDPSGAAIAGAQVSIANINTNATYQATTNESGNYTGANLSINIAPACTSSMIPSPRSM